MSNWKTGWCIGLDIEGIAQEAMQVPPSQWKPDDICETEDHLDSVLRFLGKKDSDVVYLYFLSEKRQTDICKLLDRTQPAVSYDVKRTKRHINFIIYLLSVVDEFLYFVENHGHEFEDRCIKVMVLMFFSTSFTQTAKVMGFHQITCRYAFNRAMVQLRERGFDNIADIFDQVVKNLNMVKKVVHQSADKL